MGVLEDAVMKPPGVYDNSPEAFLFLSSANLETFELRGKVVLRGRPLPVEAEQYWCRIIGTLELPQ